MANLTDYEYDIFLSHNHADQEWTTKLAERLEQEDWQGRKIKVFFSPWDIRPGQSIPQRIEQALPKSRKVGLILSPDAMKSAWVELERLVTTYITVSARDERLIPLCRRDCEIPALLQPILYLDFREDAKFEENYQTLVAVIKDEPLPRRPRTPNVLDAGRSPLVPRPIVLGSRGDIDARLKGDLAPDLNRTIDPTSERFDLFLSYSHSDAEWVEDLAKKLEDEESFRVWLDKWVLVPGGHWQQDMARGLDQADCCVVCIGEHTPDGWFKEEIQRALNRQVKIPAFRVLPLLLPDSKTINVNDFLELRTWVDFRAGADLDYAFYQLACGVRGIAPGRWVPRRTPSKEVRSDVEEKLRQLHQLRTARLVDDPVALDLQRELLRHHLIKGGKK